MIVYTEDDFGLRAIIETLPAGLVTAGTRHDYHVFGLRLSGRPHVTLSGGSCSLMRRVCDLLDRSGISCTNDECCQHEVRIGLRRDLRENPTYAAQLLTTIVQMLEDRLELFGPGTVLPQMPFAPSAGTAVADAVAPTVAMATKYVLAKRVASDGTGDHEVRYMGPDGGVASAPYFFSEIGSSPFSEAYKWIKLLYPATEPPVTSTHRWHVTVEMPRDLPTKYWCGDHMSDNASDQLDGHRYQLYGAILKSLEIYEENMGCSIACIIQRGA